MASSQISLRLSFLNDHIAAPCKPASIKPAGMIGERHFCDEPPVFGQEAFGRSLGQELWARTVFRATTIALAPAHYRMQNFTGAIGWRGEWERMVPLNFPLWLRF